MEREDSSSKNNFSLLRKLDDFEQLLYVGKEGQHTNYYFSSTFQIKMVFQQQDIQVALQLLQKRYQNLRMVVVEVENEYYFAEQTFIKAIPFEYNDAIVEENHLERMAQKECRKPAKENEPLVRMAYFKGFEESCFLFIATHHCIMDQLSQFKLIGELIDIAIKIHQDETVTDDRHFYLQPPLKELLSSQVQVSPHVQEIEETVQDVYPVIYEKSSDLVKTSFVKHTFTEDESKLIYKHAKANNLTIGIVTSAAYLIAFQNFLKAKEPNFVLKEIELALPVYIGHILKGTNGEPAGNSLGNLHIQKKETIKAESNFFKLSQELKRVYNNIPRKIEDIQQCISIKQDKQLPCEIISNFGDINTLLSRYMTSDVKILDYKTYANAAPIDTSDILNLCLVYSFNNQLTMYLPYTEPIFNEEKAQNFLNDAICQIRQHCLEKNEVLCNPSLRTPSDPVRHYQYGVFRQDLEPTPGHSKELVCITNKDNPYHLAPGVINSCSTLHELFQKSVDLYSERPFLGTRNKTQDGRPYEWKTYKQIHELKEQFAQGLEQLNLCPRMHIQDGQEQQFLGIFSKNREEWMVSALACIRSRITIVPILESLDLEAITFIINQSECQTICIENAHAQTMILVKEQCPSLQNLICFELPLPHICQAIVETGLKLYHYDAVLSAGLVQPTKHLNSPDSEDVYMICYTSGTTGTPKGAMLSHRSLLANINMVEYLQMNIDENEVNLSYLPYGHLYEQCIFFTTVSRGGSHGYYSGNPTLLLEDIQALKPTFLCTVPRILTRIYDKILEEVNSKGLQYKLLFEEAVASKKEQYEKLGILINEQYDEYFSSVKMLLGGNIRKILCGAAPSHDHIITFFKIAFGIHIYEEYGTTECAPATMTHPLDFTTGHAGGPLPQVKLRLRDVPEMGYFANQDPPKGEILLKSTQNFVGYFKNPQSTKEIFDDEGWICTGDVGLILPNGSLKVIDRIKNIFKLAQGEYVQPEKLECAYQMCSLISQIFVHGDSFRHHLVAIVVPNREAILLDFASERSYGELLRSEELKNAIIEQINEKARQMKLIKIEIPKSIHVQAEPFAVENGLLTPTFKLKRAAAKKYFEQVLATLYIQHN